jgi:hypothetical protein
MVEMLTLPTFDGYEYRLNVEAILKPEKSDDFNQIAGIQGRHWR